MVDLDASFSHHLFELAVADLLCHIPARAPEDDLPLKMTAFEFDHRGAPRCQIGHDHVSTGLSALLCDRTLSLRHRSFQLHLDTLHWLLGSYVLNSFEIRTGDIILRTDGSKAAAWNHVSRK
jgi:hypothetical protein